MTGQTDIECSSKAASVTQGCRAYCEKKPPTNWSPWSSSEDSYYWIDTKGFDDTVGEENDTEIFKKVFKFLKDEKMASIKGIIWNISPELRATQTLQKQAQLIHQFSNQDGDIWKRVLIVCKNMLDPEKAVQGAKEAIRFIQPNVNVESFGFTILDDPNIQEKLRIRRAKYHADKCPPSQPYVDGKHISVEIRIVDCKSERCKETVQDLFNDFRVWSDDDIKRGVSQCLKKFQSVPIIYRPQRCTQCGEENDKRLMSKKCPQQKKELMISPS